MTRLPALVLLLTSYLDFHPWPETWSGAMTRRSAGQAQAPGRKVRCDGCNGKRKVDGRACTRCNATGHYYIDDYTGQLVGSTEAGVSTDRTLGLRVRCDGCGGEGWHGNGHRCSRCLGRGQVAGIEKHRALQLDADGPTSRDRLLDALERQDKARSHPTWVALEHALAALHDLDPFGHFLIGWTYVEKIKPPESLHEEAQAWLQLALEALDRGMPPSFEHDLPKEITDAERHRQASLIAAKGKKAAKPVQRARDVEIRRLYETGEWTQLELARQFGIARSVVSDITRKGLKETA